MDAPNNYNINLEEEYIMKDNKVIIIKKLEQLSKPVDDHMEDIDKKKGPTTGCAGSGSSAKCCQADNCSTDLTDAKQYHRRHKVCDHHAKAQVVIVAGIRQRFCQQCSRFHEVSEFDEAKRSCRRRLAGHNERRRKNSSGDQTQAAEGSSSSSGRKGNSGTQMKDIHVCGGHVDDHHRGRGRLQISIQENSTNYNHFQIT